jgi:CspA family cold shock protein
MAGWYGLRKGSRVMATGTVKWFNDDKGYGFITPDEGSTEVFVHFSEVQGKGFRSLEPGARVQYQPETTQKGLAAKSVAVIA